MKPKQSKYIIELISFRPWPVHPNRKEPYVSDKYGCRGKVYRVLFWLVFVTRVVAP